jgi:hypothetical protein
MKKAIFLLFLAALAFPAKSQAQGQKLNSVDAASKTPDQRFVYETERKAKKKKKRNVSTKKKVRIQEKQDRQMRRKKAPQRAR